MDSEKPFEELIAALEKMTDAQDDMWQEEQYANYKFRDKIREERFVPAKKEFKEALDSYIDQKIERWLAKNPRKASQMLDGMFGK